MLGGTGLAIGHADLEMACAQRGGGTGGKDHRRIVEVAGAIDGEGRPPFGQPRRKVTGNRLGFGFGMAPAGNLPQSLGENVRLFVDQDFGLGA